MVVMISSSLEKKQKRFQFRALTVCWAAYAHTPHSVSPIFSLPLLSPSLHILLHPVSFTLAVFFSRLHSLCLSLSLPHSPLPHVSYHLPSSFAGLLRAARWSLRSVFSTSVLRWVMSHACLDMLRWSVNVMLTYARLAALQRAGAKTRPWHRVEGRG